MRSLKIGLHTASFLILLTVAMTFIAEAREIELQQANIISTQRELATTPHTIRENREDQTVRRVTPSLDPVMVENNPTNPNPETPNFSTVVAKSELVSKPLASNIKTASVEKNVSTASTRKPAQKTNSSPTKVDSYSEELVAEIHKRTNEERKRAGMSSLDFDTKLSAIAYNHSKDMATNNFFSHTSETGCTLTCRINNANYSANAWGENIAWRSSSVRPSAAALADYFVSRWMDSASHRKNILSNGFDSEGVGIAIDGDKIYATVNFSG